MSKKINKLSLRKEPANNMAGNARADITGWICDFYNYTTQGTTDQYNTLYTRMVNVCKTADFDACHPLTDYNGLCFTMKGDRCKVTEDCQETKKCTNNNYCETVGCGTRNFCYTQYNCATQNAYNCGGGGGGGGGDTNGCPTQVCTVQGCPTQDVKKCQTRENVTLCYTNMCQTQNAHLCQTYDANYCVTDNNLTVCETQNANLCLTNDAAYMCATEENATICQTNQPDICLTQENATLCIKQTEVQCKTDVNLTVCHTEQIYLCPTHRVVPCQTDEGVCQTELLAACTTVVNATVCLTKEGC